AVQRPERQRLQDQQIECALQQVGRRGHAGPLRRIDGRYENDQPSYRLSIGTSQAGTWAFTHSFVQGDVLLGPQITRADALVANRGCASWAGWWAEADRAGHAHSLTT
ncbi:MAG TPA: hypothetical protein VK864_03075, partial [Longimicrobiales bacterium]|nr:hypothetical protein [Longimicrobiales bacterium]